MKRAIKMAFNWAVENENRNRQRDHRGYRTADSEGERERANYEAQGNTHHSHDANGQPSAIFKFRPSRSSSRFLDQRI
jgi:hypothetical protein